MAKILGNDIVTPEELTHELDTVNFHINECLVKNQQTVATQVNVALFKYAKFVRLSLIVSTVSIIINLALTLKVLNS